MVESENSCTTDELVAYLYKELPNNRYWEINAMIQQNWTLHEKMEVLEEAICRLHMQPLFSPREQSVNNILRYAQKMIPA